MKVVKKTVDKAFPIKPNTLWFDPEDGEPFLLVKANSKYAAISLEDGTTWREWCHNIEHAVGNLVYSTDSYELSN